ncbi:hypothetical protein NQ318_017044 [Aromia moschata]|uniref:Uncharacterized protein n=1 Tax=Aromia moschata TaxID=1265417 RepID=A0AAV8Y9G5_9CUCU|nr:hypothetical protein NQ318_017044 [Aromia moschata]
MPCSIKMHERAILRNHHSMLSLSGYNRYAHPYLVEYICGPENLRVGENVSKIKIIQGQALQMTTSMLFKSLLKVTAGYAFKKSRQKWVSAMGVFSLLSLIISASEKLVLDGFRETHPDLPPLNQGTISKIEAQYREMCNVRKVPSKRQAVVDDYTKLNLLLALEENPITPAHSGGATANTETPGFSEEVVKWSVTDLDELDRLTRRLLTKFRHLHTNSSVIRLYLPRRRGGRGLVNIKNQCLNQEASLRRKLLTNRDPLITAVAREDAGYTPLSLGCELIPVDVPTEEELRTEWMEHALQGQARRPPLENLDCKGAAEGTKSFDAKWRGVGFQERALLFRSGMHERSDNFPVLRLKTLNCEGHHYRLG